MRLASEGYTIAAVFESIENSIESIVTITASSQLLTLRAGACPFVGRGRSDRDNSEPRHPECAPAKTYTEIETRNVKEVVLSGLAVI